MREYDPFPISNFRTGFNESVEPWLLPKDSFQTMINSHLYRGVIEKINGYGLFTRMSYTRIIQVGIPNGTTTTFTLTLPSAPTSNTFYAQAGLINPANTKEIFQYFNDASATVLNLKSNLNGTGTLNLSTLLLTLNFNTAPNSNFAAGVQYNSIIFVYDSQPLNSMGAVQYNPIMGIKPYTAANGTQSVLIFDTKRVGTINPITSSAIANSVMLNYSVTEIPNQVQTAGISTTPAFNGTNVLFQGTIQNPLVPGLVTFKLFDNSGNLLDTVTDVSTTPNTNPGSGELANGTIMHGYINYYTGQWILGFNSAPAANYTLNTYVGTYTDTFTGTFSNFFSVTNWQSLAFITNNVDPIRYYDGNQLLYLNTNVSTKAANTITYDISRCLHVEVYRQRLLLISVVFQGMQQLNTIYWSKPLLPLDFTNDEFEPATTSDPIRTYKIINTDMIVHFSNSERIFRYTNDTNAPFRWDSTNLIWRCDAPYSAINYDSYFTSVGKPAIVGSNGVNIKRVDEIIPDFTDSQRIPGQTPSLFMSQTSIGQCYGERFDDLKEGWLCYRSGLTSTVAPSDSVLAFNYLDETYATYTFPFSCLGFGTVTTIPTWGNDFRTWQSIEDTWGSFNLTTGSLIDLSGDQYGNVFELDLSYTVGDEKTGTITAVTNANPAQITDTAHGLNTGDTIIIQGVQGPQQINNQVFVVTVVDANNYTVPFDTTHLLPYTSGGVWFTSPVLMDCTTQNFNPYVDGGQLARFGYVDFFVSSNTNTTFRVQFYKDDQLDADFTTFYQETAITLTPMGQSKIWKRIYVGAVGKTHTMRIYQNPADFSSTTLNQPVRIHAIVPYFKQAGRIYQP